MSWFGLVCMVALSFSVCSDCTLELCAEGFAVSMVVRIGLLSQSSTDFVTHLLQRISR